MESFLNKPSLTTALGDRLSMLPKRMHWTLFAFAVFDGL